MIIRYINEQLVVFDLYELLVNDRGSKLIIASKLVKTTRLAA